MPLNNVTAILQPSLFSNGVQSSFVRSPLQHTKSVWRFLSKIKHLGYMKQFIKQIELITGHKQIITALKIKESTLYYWMVHQLLKCMTCIVALSIVNNGFHFECSQTCTCNYTLKVYSTELISSCLYLISRISSSDFRFSSSSRNFSLLQLIHFKMSFMYSSEFSSFSIKL